MTLLYGQINSIFNMCCGICSLTLSSMHRKRRPFCSVPGMEWRMLKHLFLPHKCASVCKMKVLVFLWLNKPASFRNSNGSHETLPVRCEEQVWDSTSANSL